ncbi:VOC family protein [Streptomyces clavuligerus]|uniref:Putative hydroxylase n=1 Tax=Streptomyces clavuligerus TaxID=1901 RepID=B5GQJ3_STRCL|nr:VOC family protein [Streptomyces clavuligerus]ANW20330.1 hydrolase [Streptomyces clavuligerus]AXU14956.1 VOC family protein [Streptomyces clavuligerus]EDY48589.1 hydroxylase [Streptomyces clavuligerus]EFG06724.1 Putative hydroxylase [Streptomyces clavuligerus]MBY6305005.1 VOC family protein [Streptomyces clavuligerus]
MGIRAEGTPCWADAMFADLEAAKSFYGELLGWSFGESAAEYGGYTQARVGDLAVAALSPKPPGMEDAPTAWNLYFATPDAQATAAKVREHGGTLVKEPMQVGSFGTMLIAVDPSGVPFSAWQANEHHGFGLVGEPGSFGWAEVCTREARKADAFFPLVFPFEVQKMESDEVDFHIWKVDGQPVAGRLKMSEHFPAEVHPFINVYFCVTGMDDTVATAVRLGGKLLYGPMPSPFGRFAPLMDPQGAMFTVIDTADTEGRMPSFD